MNWIELQKPKKNSKNKTRKITAEQSREMRQEKYWPDLLVGRVFPILFFSPFLCGDELGVVVFYFFPVFLSFLYVWKMTILKLFLIFAQNVLFIFTVEKFRLCLIDLILFFWSSTPIHERRVNIEKITASLRREFVW